MYLVFGLADAVIDASAIASALFVDAIIICRMLGKDKYAETLTTKGASLLLLFLIALTVRMVGG